MSSNAEDRLPEFLTTISQDLDRTIDFWIKHSHDDKFGGFFTCLGKDGSMYDDVKYGWLQCRQVWTYSKLYNDVERFKRPDLLEAAVKGAAFLMTHLIEKTAETWRCYFAVTRDGRPVSRQRKLFTECFYTMAMSELARATGNKTYRDEAVGMMNEIRYWVMVDDSPLEAPVFAGTPHSNLLAVPMMVVCCVMELVNLDRELEKEYGELLDMCVQQLLLHVQRDGTMILEHVTTDGKELAGCHGRLTSPGHAIECGWFLLEAARLRQDESLKETAIEKFMMMPMSYGWDKTHGGLFYFLDADGLSPTQLDWNMKLWWPHNEAMISFLMAYEETGCPDHLKTFSKVFDYCYENFVDKENGEWFGYLSEQGQLNMDFKGGPFKGCFHVPRCLLMCELMLRDIIASKTTR